MGIDGLFNFIKPALDQNGHIQQFQGLTAAIDATNWLFKGCYSCVYELHQNEDSLIYLNYMQKMIQMLKFYNIKGILVFNGNRLKAKQNAEEKKDQIRQENKQKGIKLLEEGNLEEGTKYLTRALEITQKMFHKAIDFLKDQEGIEVLVSPFEADAQISYMIKQKQADFAITEDSNLIVYGVPKIVFKIKSNGFCNILELQKYQEDKELRTQLKESNLRVFFSFNQKQVIETAILSGCDYLPNIKGLGIKKVTDFMYRFNSAENIIRHLYNEKSFKSKIPKGYFTTVCKISKIFQYQIVYDKEQEKLVNWENSDQENLELDEDVIGYKFENYKEYCEGKLDLRTREEREQEQIILNQFEKIKKSKEKQKNFEESENNHFQQQENLVKQIGEIGFEGQDDQLEEDIDIDEMIEKYNKEIENDIQDREFQSVHNYQSDDLENPIKIKINKLVSFDENYLFQICEQMGGKENEDFFKSQNESDEDDNLNQKNQIKNSNQFQTSQQTNQSNQKQLLQINNPFAKKENSEIKESLTQIKKSPLRENTKSPNYKPQTPSKNNLSNKQQNDPIPNKRIFHSGSQSPNKTDLKNQLSLTKMLFKK